MERIELEKQTVGEMIALYCRHKHGGGHGGELCADCRALSDYALQRLERCRFGNGKTSCLKCKVHCYRPAMRSEIAKVMRHSGPWMLLYHPVLTVKHLVQK